MVGNKLKLVVLICTLVLLSSCGTFTKVFKKSSIVKKDIEVVVEKESETKIEDKSKIVIEEKIDTVINTPSKTTETIIPINKIEDIINLTILSDNFVDIKQNYDSLTRSLKTTTVLKPQSIPIKQDRKTTINKDINTNVVVKQDSIYKDNSKTKDSVKDKKPINILAYILGAIGIIAVGYFITKKYFKKAI